MIRRALILALAATGRATGSYAIAKLANRISHTHYRATGEVRCQGQWVTKK